MLFRHLYTNHIVLEVKNYLVMPRGFLDPRARSEDWNIPMFFSNILFLTCESSFRFAMSLTWMTVAPCVAVVTVAGVRARW